MLFLLSLASATPAWNWKNVEEFHSEMVLTAPTTIYARPHVYALAAPLDLTAEYRCAQVEDPTFHVIRCTFHWAEVKAKTVRWTDPKKQARHKNDQAIVDQVALEWSQTISSLTVEMETTSTGKITDFNLVDVTTNSYEERMRMQQIRDFLVPFFSVFDFVPPGPDGTSLQRGWQPLSGSELSGSILKNVEIAPQEGYYAVTSYRVPEAAPKTENGIPTGLLWFTEDGMLAYRRIFSNSALIVTQRVDAPGVQGSTPPTLPLGSLLRTAAEH